MAATINLPVKVLDEKCAECKAINLEKTDYYADLDKIYTCYQCTNLHLCQYIKNRIVRNEQAERIENAMRKDLHFEIEVEDNDRTNHKEEQNPGTAELGTAPET